MKCKTLIVSVVTALCVCFMAQANESTPIEIPTLSGGIGDSGMDEITAAQNQFNLKLIFAEADGEYLADIGVEIQNNKGVSILKMNSPNSILLVKLLPGKYTIKATSDGGTKSHKIVIRRDGLVTYYFHLDTKDS